jgi:hypothetical protein
MRRAYLCSDPDAIVLKGPEYARVDRENHELEEAIAARDEAVAATTKDRARYHADLQAVEALACVLVEEPVDAAPKRVYCDSSLAEVVECCRRQRPFGDGRDTTSSPPRCAPATSIWLRDCK